MDNGGKRYDTCEGGGRRKRDAWSLTFWISPVKDFTFQGFFIDISMMEFCSILEMEHFRKSWEILRMKFLRNFLRNVDDRNLKFKTLENFFF